MTEAFFEAVPEEGRSLLIEPALEEGVIMGVASVSNDEPKI